MMGGWQRRRCTGRGARSCILESCPRARVVLEARQEIVMDASLQTTERTVEISSGAVHLPAIVGLPPQAQGIVLFAHGSGSGRLSPRNGAVAHVLQDAGLATLLADLLTEPEARDRRLV